MEIELSHISYRDKLMDFSYCFGEKRVVSIIGSSGSGKSLVGYAIMGLLKYDSGRILINSSSNYNRYDLLKNVGYVFQNPMEHFFCDLVYEEIAFGLKQFRFKMDKIDLQIRNSLKMVGLDESYLFRKICTLSSGEMERVAIASSLVLNPKVLILDEPTVYLDAKVKKELVDLINMLRDKYNKTVIVISNDMDFVCRVSDDYVLMSDGRIIKSGVIRDIVVGDFGFDGCDLEKLLITQFVDLVRDYKNVCLDYTCDVLELVEDVVRNE